MRQARVMRCFGTTREIVQSTTSHKNLCLDITPEVEDHESQDRRIRGPFYQINISNDLSTEFGVQYAHTFEALYGEASSF